MFKVTDYYTGETLKVFDNMFDAFRYCDANLDTVVTRTDSDCTLYSNIELPF